MNRRNRLRIIAFVIVFTMSWAIGSISQEANIIFEDVGPVISSEGEILKTTAIIDPSIIRPVYVPSMIDFFKTTNTKLAVTLISDLILPPIDDIFPRKAEDKNILLAGDQF